MADKSVSQASLLWIGVAVLLGAYAWWLSGQVDTAREQLRAAQAREQQLIIQLQVMAARMQGVECQDKE